MLTHFADVAGPDIADDQTHLRCVRGANTGSAILHSHTKRGYGAFVLSSLFQTASGGDGDRNRGKMFVRRVSLDPIMLRFAPALWLYCPKIKRKGGSRPKTSDFQQEVGETHPPTTEH